MLHDPRVRVISFTGSTGVGVKLLHGAADQVLKPAMELGGNAPLIVFEDADIDLAVEGAMQAKMRNLGEACTAANRFYVHEAVAEAFTEKFTAAMAALKMGNGLEEGVDVGPLVNADTRDKVAGFVTDAVEKGAEVRLGGAVPNGPGFFYPPTVLAGVPETADCVRDEIFGPVAALQTFADQGDVIARAGSWSEAIAMADTHAQRIVPGAGPGGYACAFRAADLGRDVTRVDPRASRGGICLNEGCIASKALLHATEVIREAGQMRGWGIGFAKPKLDLDRLRAKKDGIVAIGDVTGNPMRAHQGSQITPP